MKRARKKQEGFVLIMAMVLLVAVTGYLFTLQMVSAGGMRSSQFNTRKVAANYLAEGGLEAAQKSIQTALANYQAVPTSATYTINGTNVYITIATCGTQITSTDATGIQTIIQPYLITATTTYQGTVTTTYRVVNAERTPIFQFAVFYNGDLEMLPGANFTIGGRVHSNHNIYMGSDGATLTLNTNYVHAVGNMYQYRKDNGALLSGSVTALVKGTTSTYYTFPSKSTLAASGVPSTSGYDSSFAGYDKNGDGDYNDSGEMAPFSTGSQTAWNGTVQTGANGLTEVVSPSVQNLQPGGYYNTNAGLIIRGTSAYVGSTNVTSSLPSGTIAQKTMYDTRAGKTITVTEVDIAKLNSSGYFPSNGLLYAYREDASTSSPNGIRLKNGSSLNAGLTVVSPDPVYIMGNYNTGTWKPAAVISDAVNILSNAWNDTKTATTLPTATATTINAAFISGNTATTTGHYNGGLENLPRFSENWSGVTCTICGSFVNIFQSQIATGAWVYGGYYYTAPTRNWSYDTRFNSTANLPPFTPQVVNISRVAQWNP